MQIFVIKLNLKYIKDINAIIYINNNNYNNNLIIIDYQIDFFYSINYI